MNIREKVIIVTGASQGIGRATATLLAKEGAKISLVARSEDLLRDIEAELPGSFAIVADMRNPEDIKRMVRETHEHYGRIDGLINNAGQGLYGAVENIDIADYKSVFDLNVIGSLTVMQEVIPHMRTLGGGSIVNISSMLAKMYVPNLGAYSSTKYALGSLSLTARAELEQDKIIVSVVYPGLTNTDFGKHAIKSDIHAESYSSRRREGMPEPDSPEHVAERILYALTSGDAEVFMR